MKRFTTCLCSIFFLLCTTAPVWAHDTSSKKAAASVAAPASTNLADAEVRKVVASTTHDKGSQLTEGEVRKVDKDAKKITIRHGPIQSLDMPAMTMVFQVKDPALLDQVKAGDKIMFTAEKTGGAFTVTHVEPGK